MKTNKITSALSFLSVISVLSVLFVASSPRAHAGEKALIDTTRSPHAKFYMTDLSDVKWTTGFWAERFAVCRETMVPHMWDIFSDDHESHGWSNFLIAAGEGHGRDGKFHGPPFNDGDFLKWFEALIQVYAVTRDPAIDKQMDRIIEVVGKAQREDGYLHTQTIIPQRSGEKTKEFADREHFETYNMGHLITTACIHYRITGKTTMLDLARKAADYIDNLCRNKPEELARNAICPSHYMGVVELYRVTREPRYLALAKQLLEIRSLVPPTIGSDHNQDRVPLREATEALGHAVRANYLYAGVADVIAETGDASLLKMLDAVSENVADTKLYITGMTGAIYDGASPDGAPAKLHPQIRTIHQAYGRNFQLPNLTAYNETCATIGYGLWMWRMLELTGDAAYADLFEQTLYNGVLPGISLEGKDYFYVNPLRKHHDFDVPLRWSRTRQPNYKSSFCCPPNVVRTIAEAHNYVYSLSNDTLWIHLYAASALDTKWLNGSHIKLRQETDYPWDGAIKITVEEISSTNPIALKLRIPGWTHEGDVKILINGKPALGDSPKPGTYYTLNLKHGLKAGDVIELAIAFRPVLWESNHLVEESVNQVALKYGPLVYCVESNDLAKNVRIEDIALRFDTQPGAFLKKRERLANADVLTFRVPALNLNRTDWKKGELYREFALRRPEATTVKFVPYYAWGNRGDTDMTVWLPVR